MQRKERLKMMYGVFCIRRHTKGFNNKLNKREYLLHYHYSMIYDTSKQASVFLYVQTQHISKLCVSV